MIVSTHVEPNDELISQPVRYKHLLLTFLCLVQLVSELCTRIYYGFSQKQIQCERVLWPIKMGSMALNIIILRQERSIQTENRILRIARVPETAQPIGLVQRNGPHTYIPDNLGRTSARVIGYPDAVSPGKCRNCALIRLRMLSSQALPIHPS
jgi:hypothetical protein